MFEECTIRNIKFSPARFCAPMAGYTHSAFRRLISEFGGCGALWTEMLSARQLLSEDFNTSPWLKRSQYEKFLFYQLMFRPKDDVEKVVKRLADYGVEAIDINLACDAPHIRSLTAGSKLFADFESIKTIVSIARQYWQGLFTVKIRLGSRNQNWQENLLKRLKLFEDIGVDAVAVHPRFFEDKFKRTARHDLLPWIAEHCKLPLLVSGDITGREYVEKNADKFKFATAIMIGRMAIVKPWIFASWDTPMKINYSDVWNKMCQYIIEDFEPPVAIRRIQMFAKYYSANFKYGHNFKKQVDNAKSIEEIKQIAEQFFSKSPEIIANPVAGLF